MTGRNAGALSLPTEDEIVAIFHAGERAAIENCDIVDSPYLAFPDLMRIWMLGYMGMPISTAFESYGSLRAQS